MKRMDGPTPESTFEDSWSLYASGTICLRVDEENPRLVGNRPTAYMYIAMRREKDLFVNTKCVAQCRSGGFGGRWIAAHD
jgi:hypothetical protein